MPNINVKIKQNLPLNVVQLAHIGGDNPNISNAVIMDYKAVNPGLANFPFLKDYSFDVILDETQSSGELGIGVTNMMDNNIVITNIASASRFGSPIPLFYKYEIPNLVIAMPVNIARYTYLKASATTAAELEELGDMETTIDNSIIDRIYFTDLYNEIVPIKFNATKIFVSGSTFDVTVYVSGPSNQIGSMYIVYNNGTAFFHKILNSVPVFTRKVWNEGNIFFGDLL